MMKKPQTPVLDEERHEFIDSFGLRLCYVHAEGDCKDPTHCVIHHPSNHHMRDWPLHWIPDRYIFERLCPHGIGHPDPDDLRFHLIYGDGRETGVHGCDGCCYSPEKEEATIG